MNSEKADSQLALGILIGLAIASPAVAKFIGTGFLLFLAIPFCLFGAFILFQVIRAGVGIAAAILAFVVQAGLYWGYFFYLTAGVIFFSPADIDTVLSVGLMLGFPAAILLAGLRIRKGYDFTGAAFAQRFRIESKLPNSLRLILYAVVSSLLTFAAYGNLSGNQNYMNSFAGQTPSATHILINAGFLGFLYGAILFVFLPLKRNNVHGPQTSPLK